VPTIRQTDTYKRWFLKLRNSRARARINIRIRRVALGNFGDFKSVGSGVSELKIDYGPGYRIYFTLVGKEVIVLLAGGDKSTQQNDIRKAKELAADL